MTDVQPKYVYPALTKSRKASEVVDKLQTLFVQQGTFPGMLVKERESGLCRRSCRTGALPIAFSLRRSRRQGMNLTAWRRT